MAGDPSELEWAIETLVKNYDRYAGKGGGCCCRRRKRGISKSDFRKMLSHQLNHMLTVRGRWAVGLWGTVGTGWGGPVADMPSGKGCPRHRVPNYLVIQVCERSTWCLLQNCGGGKNVATCGTNYCTVRATSKTGERCPIAQSALMFNNHHRGAHTDVLPCQAQGSQFLEWWGRTRGRNMAGTGKEGGPGRASWPFGIA